MTEPSDIDKNDALRKILASEQFRDAPKLKDVLQYIVREEAEGRGEKIKAYSIAVDVFEKTTDFDPQLDPIVRVTMVRMRTTLEQYYLADGKHDPVILSIPKGAYRPSFSANPTASVDAHEHSFKVVPGKKVISWFTDQAQTRRVAALLVSAVLVWLAFLYASAPQRVEQKEAQRNGSAITVLVRMASRENGNGPGMVSPVQIENQLREALSRNAAITVIHSPSGDDSALSQSTTAGQAKPSADFVVRGSVWKNADDEQLSVELINGRTKALVWARTFALRRTATEPEAKLGIIDSAARELHTQILGSSKKTLEGRDPRSLSAEQLFVMSTWVPGPAKNQLEWEKERVALARLAIEKNPEFGPAYSVLADKLTYLANMDHTSNKPAAIKEAQASADRALELSPGDANTVFNVAQSLWHSGKLRDASRMMKRVLDLDPNHALARSLVMVIPYTCSTAPDHVVNALLALDKSLNPDNPIRWVTLSWLGWLYLLRGELELALEMKERAALIFQVPYSSIRHAVILNELGRSGEAAQVIKSQMQNWPNISPRHFSTVTIPRLCHEVPNGQKLLKLHRKLTRDVAGNLAQ